MFQERNIQNPGITEGSYISRNVAFYPYTSLIFQVASFQARKMNKKPARKNSYISGNRTFLPPKNLVKLF